MTCSALVYASIGLACSFLPQELMAYLAMPAHPITMLLLQLLSALYLGFGILNWMAKGSLIGGIYNRPIILGNLMHFAVGALALIKLASQGSEQAAVVTVLAASYSLLALAFAYVFSRAPKTLGA